MARYSYLCPNCRKLFHFETAHDPSAITECPGCKTPISQQRLVRNLDRKERKGCLIGCMILLFGTLYLVVLIGTWAFIAHRYL